MTAKELIKQIDIESTQDLQNRINHAFIQLISDEKELCSLLSGFNKREIMQTIRKRTSVLYLFC